MWLNRKNDEEIVIISPDNKTQLKNAIIDTNYCKTAELHCLASITPCTRGKGHSKIKISLTGKAFKTEMFISIQIIYKNYNSTGDKKNPRKIKSVTVIFCHKHFC